MQGLELNDLRQIRELRRNGKKYYSVQIPPDFVSSNIVAYGRDKRKVLLTWEGDTLTVRFLRK